MTNGIIGIEVVFVGFAGCIHIDGTWVVVVVIGCGCVACAIICDGYKRVGIIVAHIGCILVFIIVIYG